MFKTTIDPAQLIAWRREFHKYAEAGWLEMRTTSRLARILTDMGYQVHLGDEVTDQSSRMGLPDEETLAEHYAWAEANGADPEFLPYTREGMTGVIAELDCGEGPTILLRFDIDALGVSECQSAEHLPAKEGFTSLTDGIMHSCGHDGHMAIGLAVAQELMENRDKLRGRIIILFQPAEEGVRGAKAVTEGYLKNVKLDYAIGGHIFPDDPRPGTEVLITDGGVTNSLATIKLDAEFRGLAAHAGGAPQEGHNAMLAAATSVLNIHAMPRYGSTPTHINVGTFHAGTGRNVVPDIARLDMEVRGMDTESCDYLAEYARRILQSAADMHACTVKIDYAGMSPSFANTASIVQTAHRVLTKKAGLSAAIADHGRSTSEDFAYYAQAASEAGGQSLFMFFYTRCEAPNHNVRFDFDEDILLKGVRAFTALVEEIACK